jgi:hypothetical protein
MQITRNTFVATFLLSSTIGIAQQAPTSTQPAVQAQATNAPCSTNAPSSTVPNLGAVVKPTAKTNQTIAAARKKWSDKLGFEIPDFTSAPKPKPPAPPCPPPTAVPNTVIAPVLKLPGDFSLNLRCNPLVAPPKGTTGGSTGFTLPDPHQYGVPDQLNQLEAETVTPDISAKTGCWLIKVDPHTGKYFIAQ